MSAPTIALLTDFGVHDGYVGALKGALLSTNPDLRLVDITHGIDAGDVASGAWVLAQSAVHFPLPVVHLVVIDPGVGGSRRALACRIGGRHFVAPDNGTLHWVLGDPAAPDRELSVHAIERPDWLERASPVFHGRDLFAPAAAHLAGGGALADLGPAIAPECLVRLPFDAPTHEGDTWAGSVVHVDVFGNAVTDLSLDGVHAGEAEVRGRRIALARTYSDVEAGQPVALRGSSGTLEIACRGSSAAAVLGIVRGDVIVFRLA